MSGLLHILSVSNSLFLFVAATKLSMVASFDFHSIHILSISLKCLVDPTTFPAVHQISFCVIRGSWRLKSSHIGITSFIVSMISGILSMSTENTIKEYESLLNHGAQY